MPLCAGLILFSVIGNSLVLYNLMLGKDSLGKKRSKTIFLHITLADVLVIMFPMAGSLVLKSGTIQKYHWQAKWSGKYWTESGWPALSSARCSSFSRPLPWPPPTTCLSSKQFTSFLFPAKRWKEGERSWPVWYYIIQGYFNDDSRIIEVHQLPKGLEKIGL